jgi:hypothetical protein
MLVINNQHELEGVGLASLPRSLTLLRQRLG